jgi:hypothetical protein
MATRKCWDDWIFGGGCRCWGVVTARRFISSKINAPRSTASSQRGDTTANKGEQGTCQLSIFSVRAREGGSVKYTTPTRSYAQGVLGGVVGRGGESCWRWGQRRALLRTQRISMMEMPSLSQVFWWLGGQFSTCGSVKLPAFAT